MPSLPAASMAALLVAIALAGCSDKSASVDDPLTDCSQPEFASDPGCQQFEASESTGVIRCLVVDLAIKPLDGVKVSATGPTAIEPTKTGKSGLCAFGDLAPGTYFLTAEKDGYSKTRQSVEVVAGVSEPPVVKIQMAADPNSAPTVVVYQFDGYLECSFTLVVARVAACSVVGGVTQDNFLASYNLDRLPDWVQSEAVWTSTQPAGDNLGLSVTDFRGGGQVRVNATDGPSPIFLTIDRELAAKHGLGVNNTVDIRMFNSQYPPTNPGLTPVVQDAFATHVYPAWNSTAPKELKDARDTAQATCDGLAPYGCFLPFDRPECVPYPTLFDACLAAGGVGATVEQKFTVYTHVFYGTVPPKDWRFSKDGDPPKPQ